MQDMKKRTKEYALDIIRAYSGMVRPRRLDVLDLARQFLRSGTSVGAQYREACRAKSNADFVSKIEGCLQELEETEYWIELLAGSGHLAAAESDRLLAETKELNAMFTSMCKTVKRRLQSSRA